MVLDRRGYVDLVDHILKHRVKWKKKEDKYDMAFFIVYQGEGSLSSV